MNTRRSTESADSYPDDEKPLNLEAALGIVAAAETRARRELRGNGAWVYLLWALTWLLADSPSATTVTTAAIPMRTPSTVNSERSPERRIERSASRSDSHAAFIGGSREPPSAVDPRGAAAGCVPSARSSHL